MWINEDYNSVEMAVTDTKEVILLLNGSGKSVAVQDNRHSLAKYNPPSYYEFVTGLDAFYVDVTLVDEKYGALISYYYKIETNPLAVHEVIRVPRAAY